MDAFPFALPFWVLRSFFLIGPGRAGSVGFSKISGRSGSVGVGPGWKSEIWVGNPKSGLEIQKLGVFFYILEFGGYKYVGHPQCDLDVMPCGDTLCQVSGWLNAWWSMNGEWWMFECMMNGWMMSDWWMMFGWMMIDWMIEWWMVGERWMMSGEWCMMNDWMSMMSDEWLNAWWMVYTHPPEHQRRGVASTLG